LIRIVQKFVRLTSAGDGEGWGKDWRGRPERGGGEYCRGGDLPDVTNIEYSIGCPLPLDLSHCAVQISLGTWLPIQVLSARGSDNLALGF